MKKMALIGSAGLIMIMAGTAMAADPAPDAAHDWTGPYIGLNIGYGFGDQEQSDDTGYTSGNQDIDGVVGGGQIGFNYQMDSIVLGAEADFQFAGIDGDFESTDNWGCGEVYDKCSTQVDWFGTARLRLGYAFDNLLPYVTGGIAYGSVDSDIKTDEPGWNVSDTNVGWTVGGGLEMAFYEHFTGRVEYLYVDLGDTESTGQYDFSASANFSVVRAGVNYAF